MAVAASRETRAQGGPQARGASGSAAANAAVSPADSARIRKGARTAQERFERYRFQHFPWSHDRAAGGSCDERLGRFCIWYDDDDETRPPPPPEPAQVRTDRERLIGRLRSAAAQLPGDEWLAGQLVRYLVEGGHAEQARAAADGCMASPWWCAALTGFARHAAGDFAGADSSFAMALAGMPDEVRDRWSDLTLLLEPDDAGALRRSDAARRDSLERRLWWLADPLWMVPGNERRTEHFARHVLDRLQERGRSTEGLVWGQDLRQLLLRFGWPVAWERIVPPYPRAEPPDVRTRYAPHGRHFFPPLAAADSLAALDDASWAGSRRPRTEYAPGYAAAGFGNLRTQVARFRRGDSTLVVAVFDMAGDSVMARDGVPADALVDAALVVALGPDAPWLLARDSAARLRGALSAAIPPGPAVLSVEALDRARKHAARARVGVGALPDGGALALSDLLMLDGVESLPRTLADALPVARGGARWRSGERVAVFWEMYRAGADTATGPISLALSFHELRRGVAARIARRIGLLGGPVDVALRWTESAASAAVIPRAITLQLPTLSPGHYELQLRAVGADGREVMVARKVNVAR